MEGMSRRSDTSSDADGGGKGYALEKVDESKSNLKVPTFSFIFPKELTILRYHYEKPTLYLSNYGITYECNHPVYDKCTLFQIDKKGLAVIQQRFDESTKQTWWGEIDPWLTDALYLHPKFKEFFEERSGEPQFELYPTVTIRQIMWGLKIKPIPRERWETCFDRRAI